MIAKQPDKTRFAIVGGGMLGLTLTLRLAKRGHDITLIEAAPSLGGLASVWQLGDIIWDKHYHVTLLSDSRLRNLIDEIGLGDDLVWVETKTGFYTNGNLYSMSDTAEFLKFPPLSLEEFLSDMERMYGHFSRNDVLDFRISRVRNVMAIPTIRYSEILPPMKSSVDGLYVVNSSYIMRGNLNVNESIAVAEQAMETVLAEARKRVTV